MSTDEDSSPKAAWIHYHRGDLQRLYGSGTFVALYECAIIDWDTDAEALRERADRLVGDTVFVAPVSLEPPPRLDDLGMQASRQLDELEKAMPYRRRLIINVDRHFEIQDLIGGRGCELLDGIVYVDGAERRYAEHDYRLLVEHGLVPQETLLAGGIIFWKDAPTQGADTTWISMSNENTETCR